MSHIAVPSRLQVLSPYAIRQYSNTVLPSCQIAVKHSKQSTTSHLHGLVRQKELYQECALQAVLLDRPVAQLGIINIFQLLQDVEL